MKLLHTGDLHLGKNLHENSLLVDQKIMLDQLKAELGRDSYTALLISGDIYDRTIPPAEAVELFSGFLVALRQDFPDLTVAIIPGNHDSAQRLAYADQILGHQHIHIICNPEKSFNPISITSPNGEKLALFLLPFLSAGSLQLPERPQTGEEFDFSEAERPILLSQAEMAAEASRRFKEILSRDEYRRQPAVLMAHFFTTSGQSSESERAFIGTAELVNPALFSAFQYVALGHLHRSQKITDRMYYSGSPLAYAFDEAGHTKHFLKVEIDCLSAGFPVTVRPVPVIPFRKLTCLTGRFDEFYNGTAYDAYAADYLEITLTDPELVANPMNLLRAKFPDLLSLKQGMGQVPANGAPGDTGLPESLGKAEHRDPLADFRRFEELLYGSADPAKLELFTQLLAECADEA